MKRAASLPSLSVDASPDQAQARGCNATTAHADPPRLHASYRKALRTVEWGWKLFYCEDHRRQTTTIVPTPSRTQTKSGRERLRPQAQAKMRTGARAQDRCWAATSTLTILHVGRRTRPAAGNNRGRRANGKRPRLLSRAFPAATGIETCRGPQYSQARTQRDRARML